MTGEVGLVPKLLETSGNRTAAVNSTSISRQLLVLPHDITVCALYIYLYKGSVSSIYSMCSMCNIVNCAQHVHNT